MTDEIIVGAHAVGEALRVPGRVHRLYIVSDAKAIDGADLAATAREAKIPVEYVPLAKLNSLASTKEHQGSAAAISPVTYISLPELMATCPDRASLLILDRIQHTRNAGMIVRTAAAAGASGIIVPSRGSAKIDETLIRASAGALFHIPIARVSNIAQALRQLQDAGFWCFGLDAAEGENIYEAKWPARYAFVLGNESDGMRPGVKKNCDSLIHIPIESGAESLNVALAAGIALFEARRAART